MLKRTAIAIALLCLFLLAPGSATAKWTHYLVDITTPETIEYSGEITFNNPTLGQITCGFTSRATLEPGTTGYVLPFALSGSATEVCKTTGALGLCQVHAMETTALPWKIHTESSRFSMWPEFHFSFGGVFCTVKSMRLTSGLLYTIPDNLNLMTKIYSKGALSADQVNLNGSTASGGMTVHGMQEILGEGSATYGLN